MTLHKAEQHEGPMTIQNAALALATYTMTEANKESVVAKRNHWTVGERLVNAALDIAVHLDMANSMRLDIPSEAAARQARPHGRARGADAGGRHAQLQLVESPRDARTFIPYNKENQEMPSTNPVVPPDRAQEKRIEIMTNAAAREAASDITPRLREVVEIIMFYADKYGATEELLSLDDVNIESLTALINKYEVVPEDQNAIMVKIQLIVLDLMGKLNATWYTIWNDTVKPALNHIHNTRKAAKAEATEE